MFFNIFNTKLFNIFYQTLRAWLWDTDPEIEHLSARVEDITGLETQYRNPLSSAEPFQVCCSLIALLLFISFMFSSKFRMMLLILNVFMDLKYGF